MALRAGSVTLYNALELLQRSYIKEQGGRNRFGSRDDPNLGGGKQ